MASIKSGKRKPEPVTIADCRGNKRHLCRVLFVPRPGCPGVVEIDEQTYQVHCVSGLDTVEFVQPGPNGQRYTVDCWGLGPRNQRCTCADYRFHWRKGPCKHLGATRAIQAAVQPEPVIHDDSTPLPIDFGWEE